MAVLRQCEFFLLRYVPDAVKDEFVNIGVVMLEPDPASGGAAFADLRFTRDWSRVRWIDPAADLDMLAALEQDLRQRVTATSGEREAILAKLRDSWSNLIQLSSTKACLTEDPREELESLAQIYLQARSVPRERALGARARIVVQMRDAFEQAGVWQLMWKKVPASQYGTKGDPLRIDCGYKPNGIVRLFHGLSLATSIDSAKALAFSYPQLREGIRRELKAKTELTAVVDSDLAIDGQTEFTLNMLRDAEILIAAVSSMPQLAERARVELKI